MYTTEIADKDIRGTLGSYFQLQVNAGILFAYVMGSFVRPTFRIPFHLSSKWRNYFTVGRVQSVICLRNNSSGVRNMFGHINTGKSNILPDERRC